MDEPFEDDPRRKLARANEHLYALNAQAENLRARTDFQGVVVEYDPDEGNHVMYMDSKRGGDVGAVLRSFGVVLGDFIHNTRGALDHITWRLACKQLGHEPSEIEARSVLFPISRRPEDFAASAVLGFISEEAGAEMERAQPYHASDPAKHPLALLHWLSNRDKHRLVVPAFGETDWSSFRLKVDPPPTSTPRWQPTDFTSDPSRMFQGHIEVGRIEMEEVEANVSVESQPALEIRFSGPTHNVSRDDLAAIHGCARGIIDRLDGFL